MSEHSTTKHKTGKDYLVLLTGLQHAGTHAHTHTHGTQENSVTTTQVIYIEQLTVCRYWPAPCASLRLLCTPTAPCVSSLPPVYPHCPLCTPTTYCVSPPPRVSLTFSPRSDKSELPPILPSKLHLLSPCYKEGEGQGEGHGGRNAACAYNEHNTHIHTCVHTHTHHIIHIKHYTSTVYTYVHVHTNTLSTIHTYIQYI